MKNLKIRVKLIGSFLIVLALAVVIGVIGILSLTSAAGETALLAQRTQMSVIAARMNRNVQAQRAAFRGASTYRLAGNLETMQSNVDELHTLESDFLTMADDLESQLTTVRGKELFAEIRARYADFEIPRDTYESSVVDLSISDEQMIANLDAVAATVAPLGAAVAAFVDFMAELTTEQAANAATTSQTTTIMMVAILAGIAAIAIVLALVISSMISKPLAKMQAVLVQTGTSGDLNFSEEQVGELRREAQYRDEIGKSINSFVMMMDRLLYVGARLNDVANGDLTAQISLLSERDTMGVALKNMNDNLNYMFSEINSVAQQVTTASTEIAQGAQTLAQGSTEQASTVQEISASINEVTQQSNVSVQTANEAAKESQAIRGIAQDGNDKMERLASAVQAMSDASQSIGNVIKVIDDIAFQTNILALNAAVEAARAGQHGKGFAVVADEVRSLAGKSAEAAKETAELISANIEKSELGLTLSNETADSLRKIVEGVEKTTESLGNISQQNESSKAATEQVNLAVDQVAQVVQQNSATSEQSAAASQEMSSQAQVLQQLIGRFKLNSAPQLAAGAGVRQALPAGSNAVMLPNASMANNNVIF